MMILKILKTIIEIPLMIKYGLYLELKYFSKLENICKKRLKKNNNDFIALFYLMYCYTYQKSFDLSQQYFIKMLKIENVSYKTQKYFIYNVIKKRLKNNEYESVIRYCEELLTLDKNYDAKILIKRALCEAYYYISAYNKLLNLCQEMKIEYPDKTEITNFANTYIKIVKEKK